MVYREFKVTKDRQDQRDLKELLEVKEQLALREAKEQQV
jgi:hypothetical protein